MAGSTYTAAEVLKLLEDNEQMEDEVSSLLNTVDLDAESDDEDFAEGDGVTGDGSAMLLPPEYLIPDASHLVFESIGDILPAERDSLFFSDSDTEQSEESSDDDTG